MSIGKNRGKRCGSPAPAQHLVLNLTELLPQVWILWHSLGDGGIPGASVNIVSCVQVLSPCRIKALCKVTLNVRTYLSEH